MKILFTHGNNIASKLICKVTGELTSHVAVQIGEFVIHSNFRGLHIETLSYFITHSTILKTIEVPDRYIKKAEDIYDKNAFHSYDFIAFIALGLKSLKIPLPKINLWNISGMFICTEFVSEVLMEKELLLTPEQLYQKVSHEFLDS